MTLEAELEGSHTPGQLGVGVQVCNPSTQEAEVKESQKFEVSQSFKARLGLKNKTIEKRTHSAPTHAAIKPIQGQHGQPSESLFQNIKLVVHLFETGSPGS